MELQQIIKLSREDIINISKWDNAGAGNVIRGLNEECYGVSSESEKFESISFIYINGKNSISGYAINLIFQNDYFYEGLIKFSFFLSEKYNKPDPIGIYNTYTNYLRNILEQNDYFTVSSLELRKYKGKNIELYSKQKIEIVKNFEKTDIYKSLLNSKNQDEIVENTNYVYLMLNEETNYFKIGYSKNPEYREETLQSKEPKISLIKYWECTKKIEREMHSYFSKKRVRGEWFNLNINDLKILNDRLNNYSQQRA